MFYYILGIIVGILLIVNSILLLIKKTDWKMNILFLFSGIALILVSVIGIIINKEYEYIMMIILLTIIGLLFVIYFISNKKGK